MKLLILLSADSLKSENINMLRVSILQLSNQTIHLFEQVTATDLINITITIRCEKKYFYF